MTSCARHQHCVQHPLQPGRECSPSLFSSAKTAELLAGLRGCWERSQGLLSLKCVCDKSLVSKWGPHSWGTTGFVQIIFLRPWENVMILAWTKSLKVEFFIRPQTFHSKIISKAFTGRWTPNNTYLRSMKALEMPLWRRRQRREGRQWLRGASWEGLLGHGGWRLCTGTLHCSNPAANMRVTWKFVTLHQHPTQCLAWGTSKEEEGRSSGSNRDGSFGFPSSCN